MIRVYRPVGDWQRHYPTARSIAAELARWPGLASLRYRRLLADIRERFGVSTTTAAVAIRLWRQA